MKIACRIGFHAWEDQKVGMLCPMEWQICRDCGLDRRRNVLNPGIGWTYKTKEPSRD
jgi:hypothetical protein